MDKRLDKTFFQRDVLEVAPELLGKILVRRFSDNREEKYVIMSADYGRTRSTRLCKTTRSSEAGLLIAGSIFGGLFVSIRRPRQEQHGFE